MFQVFSLILRYRKKLIFYSRTATENAVLFHAKGPNDYIKLTIVNGNQLQFQYQAGSGPIAVIAEVSYKLSDNQWHSGRMNFISFI